MKTFINISIRLLLLFSILVSMQACEQLLFEENLDSDDPFTNFDYLWKECDEKYSFFSYKNIDWNEVKSRYRAKIYKGMSKDSLFNVLAKMLNELKDGHVNLASDFNVSIYPVEAIGQDNFDERIIKEKYLNFSYYVTGPFVHNFLSKKNIGYIRFAEFTGTVNDDQMDFMLERYKDAKGMILDIRENGGGDISDLYSILNRFIDKKTLIYNDQLKEGPDHDDFTSLQASYIEPHSGIKYLKKLVVLTDRSTYSAGSFFTLAAKQLPMVTVIGDFTGDGLGAPNGGQLPNGWFYRFSITRTISVDGLIFESGVPPDILQNIDVSDKDRDAIIERAIEEIDL